MVSLAEEGDHLLQSLVVVGARHVGKDPQLVIKALIGIGVVLQ